MAAPKKIISQTGVQMLSARVVAKRLRCAPDYVGRLCREGKLTGERVDGAWFVSDETLRIFQKKRTEARDIRAAELAAQLRKESATTLHRSRLVRFFTPTSFLQRSILVLITAGLLYTTGAAAGVAGRAVVEHFAGGLGMASSSTAEQQAAALAQVESPFFGGYTFSLPFVFSPSAVLSRVAKFFSNLTNGTSDISSEPTQPTITQPPAPSTVINNYTTNNNTYNNTTNSTNYNLPTQTFLNADGGISKNDLETKLNKLRQEIYSVGNTPVSPTYSSGGVVNNIALTQKIDKLSGVTISNSTVNGLSGLTDADIPNDITASNYLALSGGTLFGAVDNSSLATSTFSGGFSVGTLNVSSTTATSTFANGINLSSGCFSISGTCITAGGGSGTPGGSDTQVQFNDGGSFGGDSTFTFSTTDQKLTTLNFVTTNSTSTNATSTSFFTSILKMGRSGGLLQATNVVVSATSSPPAAYFVATSSTANLFPYASSTAITATTASTTNLIVSSAGGTPGCATFAGDGTISNTGSACGSGSGTFSWTPTTYSGTAVNATSTAPWLKAPSPLSPL